MSIIETGGNEHGFVFPIILLVRTLPRQRRLCSPRSHNNRTDVLADKPKQMIECVCECACTQSEHCLGQARTGACR